MPVFRLLYRNASHHSNDFLPLSTELVAPKGWEPEEVIDAYVNQNPSHTVIACQEIEQ